MAGVAIPFRIRRPHRGGRGPAPAQLVAPEEAQDETERREHEKKSEEQEDRRVHPAENDREGEPRAMRAREARGKERREKEKEPADRKRDGGRGVAVPQEEKAAEDGEEAAHGPSETAVG